MIHRSRAKQNFSAPSRPAIGMIYDPGQHVNQPGSRIDVVYLAVHTEAFRLADLFQVAAPATNYVVWRLTVRRVCTRCPPTQAVARIWRAIAVFPPRVDYLRSGAPLARHITMMVLRPAYCINQPWLTTRD